jgi:lipoprotein-releasing system permease protein
MILASSVLNGFQNEIEAKVFGFWGHVSVSNASLTSQFDANPLRVTDDLVSSIKNIEQGQLEDREGEIWKTEGGVAHVQGTALLPGIVRNDDLMDGIILKGVGEDFDPGFYSSYLKQGIGLGWTEEPSSGVVVSEQTAGRLGLQVGDRMDLLFVIDNKQFPRRFEIIGIYRTGLEEYDRKFVLVDIRRIRQLLKWDDDQVGALEVFLDEVKDAPLMADYIYYEILENDEYAESIKDKFPGIFEWLELQSINEWVILGLMLLVCILNMMTTLLILILEKTKMIGLLKALGARNWSIRKIFIIHGTRILGVGLLWGNLFGLGLALVQKVFGIVKLNEADYYLSKVPIQFDPLFILSINLGTVVIVSICLLLPTAIISKVDPIRALRFT